MAKRKFVFRYSLVTVFLICTAVCLALSIWAIRAQGRINALQHFHDEGAIVAVETKTPRWIPKWLGRGPLFLKPRVVEFYAHVTDDGFRVGEQVLSLEAAKERLLELKSEAMSLGANDVQLWIIAETSGDVNELMMFAIDNFTAAGIENLPRYTTRWDDTQPVRP